MLGIGTVVMGVGDLHRAVDFWTQALNYVPRREINAEDDFAVLVPAAGPGTHLALDVSESPVQQYPRVHLDLYAGDAADQASEVERLVSLGASRVDWDRYPADPDFVVLADPEGNRFCVIDTSQLTQSSRSSLPGLLLGSPTGRAGTRQNARAEHRTSTSGPQRLQVNDGRIHECANEISTGPATRSMR